MRTTPLSEMFGPEPPETPRRLVCLCPSLTETLFDLGAGGRLVGVTRFCIHPAEGVAGLRRLGGTKDPDLGAIHALVPDLVLANREENRREDVEALARKLPVHVSHPRAPADVARLVEELGELLGVTGNARRLAERLRAGIDALERTCRGVRFRYAYLVWRRPWMAAGAETYIDGLLRLAGGENVFTAEHGAWPTTSLDALRNLGPQLVVLPSEPFPFSERHLEELREARVGGELALEDGDDLCWHGSRTLRGLERARSLASRFSP